MNGGVTRRLQLERCGEPKEERTDKIKVWRRLRRAYLAAIGDKFSLAVIPGTKVRQRDEKLASNVLGQVTASVRLVDTGKPGLGLRA